MKNFLFLFMLAVLFVAPQPATAQKDTAQIFFGEFNMFNTRTVVLADSCMILIDTTGSGGTANVDMPIFYGRWFDTTGIYLAPYVPGKTQYGLEINIEKKKQRQITILTDSLPGQPQDFFLAGTRKRTLIPAK